MRDVRATHGGNRDALAVRTEREVPTGGRNRNRSAIPSGRDVPDLDLALILALGDRRGQTLAVRAEPQVSLHFEATEKVGMERDDFPPGDDIDDFHEPEFVGQRQALAVRAEPEGDVAGIRQDGGLGSGGRVPQFHIARPRYEAELDGHVKGGQTFAIGAEGDRYDHPSPT